MESAKQRIRAAAARQKAEKQAQTAGGEASSTPKAPTGQAKRKPDGSDRRPAKKIAVTPASLKEKSPLKPSHGVGKGLMTSQGPVAEGPSRLLTHRDYAVVLYAHSTLGNSSGHMPFAPSSRVLIILSKDRFMTSTWPLA